MANETVRAAASARERAAEPDLLGAVLLDEGVLRLLAEDVTPDAFSTESHATIYGAALELVDRGERVTLETLVEELRALDALEAAGGEAAIAELVRDRVALRAARTELAERAAEERRRRAPIGELPQVPPHNLEAELALLGGLLLDPSRADLVARMLAPEDFHLHAHGELYVRILDLARRDRTPDRAGIAGELEPEDLDALGGVGGVEEIARACPDPANVEHYTRLVRESAVLRELIQAADEIRRDAFESREDAGAIVERAARRIADLRRRACRTVRP